MIPQGITYCSLCGHQPRLPVDGQPRHGSNTALIILAVVLGIPLAACGGCMLLAAGGQDGVWIVALVGLIVLGGLLYALFRKPKDVEPL